jgi:hypothetical protein
MTNFHLLNKNFEYTDCNTSQKVIFAALILCILLIAVFFTAQTLDARTYDFAAYWQAGYMIIHGKNVYDSEQWLSIRDEQKTALHSEIVFQYPLPLAILISPLSHLPIQHAYMTWILVSILLISLSIFVLLLQNKKSSPIFIGLVIGGMFLFRPMYTVIFSGQILSILLFASTLAILCFQQKKWFFGGILLSILILKPSIGLPILALAGLWLISVKAYKAIAGLTSGCVVMLLIGMYYNPLWIKEYWIATQSLLTRYSGMHATAWGVFSLTLKDAFWSNTVTLVVSGILLSVLIYLFWVKKTEDYLAVFAILLPTGLLIAPYSWSYDQILIIISLVFIINKLSTIYGYKSGLIFLFLIQLLAIGFFVMANSLFHDVWSVTVTFLVLGISITVYKHPLLCSNKE